MRHTIRRSWAGLALALVLVLVAVGAGCGGGGATASRSSAPATVPVAQLSADEIVAKSDAAMKEVTSAAMTADVSLTAKGDPAKMTDPTSQQLLSSPIKLHLEGKESTQPVAVDMTVNIAVMGQTLDLGVLADGEKVWLEYQGKYYEVDQKSAKGITGSAGTGLSPMEELKKQGLDVKKWGLTYELVGIEDMGGTQAYHVSGKVDAKKMAAALLKELRTGDLTKQLGDATTTQQLMKGLSQNRKQMDQLAKSLSGVSGDFWYEADTFYMRKATMSATLATKGQKGMQGLDSVALSLALKMSDFNQPVTVTPPADSQPLSQLLNQMFGGMLGGSSLGI